MPQFGWVLTVEKRTFSTSSGLALSRRSPWAKRTTPADPTGPQTPQFGWVLKVEKRTFSQARTSLSHFTPNERNEVLPLIRHGTKPRNSGGSSRLRSERFHKLGTRSLTWLHVGENNHSALLCFALLSLLCFCNFTLVYFALLRFGLLCFGLVCFALLWLGGWTGWLAWGGGGMRGPLLCIKKRTAQTPQFDCVLKV